MLNTKQLQIKGLSKYEAVQVITDIAERYAYCFKQEDYAFLNNNINDLEIGEPDIEEITEIILGLLKPALEREIRLARADLTDATEIQEATLESLVKLWEKHAPRGATTMFVDELTMNILETEKDQVNDETEGLQVLERDYRDLMLASYTLKPSLKEDITPEWAEDKIMEIAYG